MELMAYMLQDAQFDQVILPEYFDTMHYIVYTILLYSKQYTLYYYKLYTVLYSTQYTVYTILYSIHYTIQYTQHYTLYSIHYTMYTVTDCRY